MTKLLIKNNLTYNHNLNFLNSTQTVLVHNFATNFVIAFFESFAKGVFCIDCAAF